MPTGTILAYSVPDGADVFVDGVSVSGRFGPARTPTIIPGIPAGTRNVTFRLYEYDEATKSLDVPQAGYVTITAILHRKI